MAGQIQAADIDELLRRFDLELHQIEQIGAAGDEFCRRPAGLHDGRFRRIDAGVIEAFHAPSPVTSRIASTMFGIGRAAADIAAHPFGDLGLAEHDATVQRLADMAGPALPRLLDHAGGRANLAGRAIAALKGVVPQEGRLERMQFFGRSQTLDGEDVVALMHHRERQAGIDPPPIHQHRAGAALAVIAPLLGAGQMQMLAQQIEQRGTDVDADSMGAAVDCEADRRRSYRTGERSVPRIGRRGCRYAHEVTLNFGLPRRGRVRRWHPQPSAALRRSGMQTRSISLRRRPA